MLKGNRCPCVFVFPYICLAKGNLIVPVIGLGLLASLCSALQCSVWWHAGDRHMGCPDPPASPNDCYLLRSKSFCLGKE